MTLQTCVCIYIYIWHPRQKGRSLGGTIYTYIYSIYTRILSLLSRATGLSLRSLSVHRGFSKVPLPAAGFAKLGVTLAVGTSHAIWWTCNMSPTDSQHGVGRITARLGSFALQRLRTMMYRVLVPIAFFLHILWIVFTVPLALKLASLMPLTI